MKTGRSRQTTTPLRISRRPQSFRLTAALHLEGGWHIAECLEVRMSGCGRTAQDALRQLRAALALYFSKGCPGPRFVDPLLEFVDVPVPARRRKPSR